MEKGLITCPKCGHEFELSEALTGQVREHLRSELQEESIQREAKIKSELEEKFTEKLDDLQKDLEGKNEEIKTFQKIEKELRKKQQALQKAQESIELEISRRLDEEREKISQETSRKLEAKYTAQVADLNTSLENRDKEIEEFRTQELELRRKQRELEESSKSLEVEVARRVDEEREKIGQETSKKLEAKYTAQVANLNTSLENRDKEIEEFRTQELELRKKQRELEESKKSLELEVTRKVDEEREKIRKETTEKANEEHRRKELEKDKIITDLRTSLDDMKRKAEQGSMETQGEVLEQDFETKLRNFFPHDDIRPVPKGIRGADIVQKVCTPSGIECGLLLWETKNTKTWSTQWIPKLKDDMIKTRATIAILISVAIPEGINRFGFMDGVWVSDSLSAIPLTAALREQLIAVNHERTASIGKNEKIEALYQYLAGSEFKQKIEGIVDAFTSMQDQLNQERRAMEKQWKQREKEIERVIKNTVGLYGDMQGIIGGRIASIPALELGGEIPKRLPDKSVSPPKEGSDKNE